MPFELANAPSTFQSFVNDVLGNDILDLFVTAYIDDILIFSKTLKEHGQHVNIVVGRLQAAGLQSDINKCEFEVHQTKYLGLIIHTASEDGKPGYVSMDPSKTEAITSWETPRNVKDIQGFFGFANFYRRFLKGFAKLTAPLTALTRKDQAFTWTSKKQDTFQVIKQAFISAPVLQHFDPDKECIVETDASDYVSGAILLQPHHKGALHPVAYMSKRHLLAECNYEIYDKELLAIVRAFKEWHAELEGSPEPVKVISDHKNLEYFMSTKRLSRRQARWSEFLSRFNFKISYKPGSRCKADPLTRRSQDLPTGVDPRLDYME